MGSESPRAAQFTRISLTGDAVVVDLGNRWAGPPAERLFSLERRVIDRGGRHSDRFAARFVAWRIASRVAVQQIHAALDSCMKARNAWSGRNGVENVGWISTARRWAEYLVAILGGNIIYLAIEPQLPISFRHRMFQIDLGLALDFLICVACTASSAWCAVPARQRLTLVSFGDLLVAPRSWADVVKQNS